MTNHVDLLIVGAGPAGLAAACAARSCGLDVNVVDDQGAVGGQLFRHIQLPFINHALDLHDYNLGNALLEKFEASGASFSPHTSVWGIEGNCAFASTNNKSEKISASKILFTTGAMERPVPFDGWTLPGVYTAGAAEIMFRAGGSLMSNKEPVVLAGNGPLLLSLAMHLLDENIPILAWLDTGRITHKLGSIMHMGHSLRDIPYFKRGMAMAMRILKARIPIIQGVSNITALGNSCVEKISYEKNGSIHEIDTKILIRHEGIIPRIQIANALEVDLQWDSVQRYWYPKTDIFGRTNINNIYMTGDAAFVNGGEASIWKGELAGIAIAADLGVISQEEAKKRSIASVKSLQTICKARNYLRYVFAPNSKIFQVPDETLICRCECVKAKDIRQAVQEGYSTPDEVKRFTRCGMGTCQGRMCGSALAEIVAQEQGLNPKNVGILRNRQPFRPITLADYCNLHGN